MPSVFSHGDLRLYLLNLLAEGPHHGYDLIQALSDRTGGTYTPSAGTVYPRLSKLEEEGLVESAVEGRKTVYTITPAGRAEVLARSDEMDDIEAGLSDSVRLIADEVRGSMRDAMRSLRADLAAAGQDAAGTAATPPPASAESDRRTLSRVQVRRTDAVLNAFRGSVRTAVRTHVARGGILDADAIDELEATLDQTTAALAARLTR